MNFNLPLSCHTDIENVLNEGIPFYDVVCKRSVNFICTCLSSSNAAVKFVACHGITYSRVFCIKSQYSVL